MGTVSESEAKLQKTIRYGKELYEKLKTKSAELMLARQLLPVEKEQERAEILELCNQVTDCIARLKADMRTAELVSHKLEGHVMWKAAVRNLWGEDGLRQCYEHMKKQEADRIRSWHSDVPPKKSTTT